MKHFKIILKIVFSICITAYAPYMSFCQDELDSTLATEALKIDTGIKYQITPLAILKRLIAKPNVNYEILFKSKVEAGKEYLLVKVDSSLGKFWIQDIFGNLVSISTIYSKDNSINEIQLRENFWNKSYAETIKKKYGLGVWNKILKGNVFIGWNKELCRLSWGEPKDINTTITARGTDEQWVYGSSFLYFENGKLTAIQN